MALNDHHLLMVMPFSLLAHCVSVSCYGQQSALVVLLCDILGQGKGTVGTLVLEEASSYTMSSPHNET